MSSSLINTNKHINKRRISHEVRRVKYFLLNILLHIGFVCKYNSCTILGKIVYIYIFHIVQIKLLL